MEKLKDYLGKYKAARILDIATGQGSFIAIIAHLYDDYSEIIGIDHQERAVEAAKRNFKDKRISFMKMDSDEMNFKKHSFDIVCLSNSLHHMKDIDKSISDMANMVKPEGILILNEMISDNDDEKQMTHTYFHHFWAETNRVNGIIHNETMTHREILNILENHPGIKLEEAWKMNMPEQGEIPAEAYEHLKVSLDKSLEAVKKHPEYERFNLKAEELKTRLDNIGFKSATQILAIARISE